MKTLPLTIAAAAAVLLLAPELVFGTPVRAEPNDAARRGPAPAIVIGSHPVAPLAEPGKLILRSAGASIELSLAGQPVEWVETINRFTARTGIEAVITDHTMVLDDGTYVDPAGDGYLLLRTRHRGRSAAIAAVFTGPLDSTGFTPTVSDAIGAE